MAPPWFPVPPVGYGGIEIVVDLLARELRVLGHQVTLFAVEGSDPGLDPVALVPGDWGEDLGTPFQRVREAHYELLVNRELDRRAGELDVVHLHTEFAGMTAATLLRLPIPCVATIHCGMDEKVIGFLEAVQDEVGLVAISQTQRSQAPSVRWAGAVLNAVPLPDRPVKALDEGYLVQLARVTPDKGQHLAIEVAERVGMPLRLAGKVDRDAESRSYFEQLIAPRLSRSISWVEDISGTEKADFLAGASAMLFPIQWEEPFGLAMIEAMLLGTPVIAFRRGAAGELVEEGVTGFLVESVDEMAERVRDLGSIDTEACARHARERFSPSRMAAGYETVYRQAMAAGHPPRRR